MARKNQVKSLQLSPSKITALATDKVAASSGSDLSAQVRRSLALGLGVFVGVLVVASLRKD